MQQLKKLSSTSKGFVCFYVLGAIMFISISSTAQNWTNVGSGFVGYPTYFFSDSVTNTLYATGVFTWAGGHQVKGAARFIDVEWDTMPINNHASYAGMFRFSNKLFYSDNYAIYSWDSTQIDTIGKFSPNGVAYGFTVHHNDLVAWGSFDSINGVAANLIAKWDGFNWSAFDTTRWYGAGIVNAMEYLGELYIGGNMWNYNGTLDRLARWNGIQWLPVGNGIVGGMASVSSFEIFHDDLYIGGGFNTVQGNPGNSIARWDGVQWKDVGIGMTNPNAVVRDLQAYNNELYACGSFNLVGDLSIQGIAKWNGSRWCGLGFDSYTIMAMAVYNNELYIGGPFLTIDGDTVNNIAKWVGGNYTDTCGIATDVRETGNETAGIIIYPNPTTAKLKCTFTNLSTKTTLQIFGIEGRSVTQPVPATQTSTEIDVSYLPAGLYFLVVQDERQRAVQKFVKE